MDKIEIRDELTIIVRSYLSVTHILAAAHFARLSTQLEIDEKTIFIAPGRFSEDWLYEYRAYVTASIFSSVAFLEAAINELYADAYDNQFDQLKQLDPGVLPLLTERWREENFQRYKTTLEKYEIALKLISRKEFDKGKEPYQPVRFLFALRNALVHYVPDLQMTPAAAQLPLEKDFEKYLKGKFSINPLYRNSDEAFFPEKGLSAGCAKWAVKSSLDFADNFFSQIGLTPPYDGIRNRLGEKKCRNL